MVFDLTVIKHNHPKSKYPTHESGITWQPRVHPPMILEVDNKGAVNFINDWSVAGQTRHIQNKQYFL